MLGHTLEATLCGWLYAVSLFQCVSLSHGDLGVIESNSAHRNNLCMCVYVCMSANMNARVLICLCACMPACLHTCMLACLHALVQAQAIHTTDAMRLWTTLPLPVLELSVHVPVDEAALLINGLRTRRTSGRGRQLQQFDASPWLSRLRAADSKAETASCNSSRTECLA